MGELSEYVCTNVMWFRLCVMVAARAVSGEDVVLCSGMPELQNCFNKSLKFHITPSNHTPFHTFKLIAVTDIFG